MSPTSYQLLYSAISDFVVPVTGLEPVQYRYREILSLLCLPFHHTGSFSAYLEYHIYRRNVNPTRAKKEKNPSTAFAAGFRATFHPAAHILTKDQKEEVSEMTLLSIPALPDIDDLIYQDCWSPSER